MDSKTSMQYLQDRHAMKLDEASIASAEALAAKLNAQVMQAADERLAFDDEPATFLKALRSLRGTDA